jgi:membrane protease YdiL (CAAX protease family)
MSASDAPLQRLTFDNPWIAEVDRARRALPAWLVLVAGLAAAGSVNGLAGLVTPAAAAVAATPMPGGLGPLAGGALLYALAFLPLWLVALLGGRIEGRRVWRSERRPVLAAAGGALLGLVGFGAALTLAGAAGVVHPGATGAAAGALAGLLVFAYQAGAEEVLFRGWMQPVLCARFGPWVGLVIVATVFGVMHLVGAPRSPVAVINLMLGGLMFGLLALRTGGLWAAFAAHGVWNWTESCGVGLDPNPGVGAFGALIDLDLAGPALWSGGEDGLNGSLALTLVLGVIVTVLIALRARPR